MKEKLKIYLGVMFTIAAIYNAAYNLISPISILLGINPENWLFKGIDNNWGERGFIMLGIIILLSTIICFVVFRNKFFNTEILLQRLQNFLRYFLFFVFFAYAFAKTMGNQFSLPDFFADMPLSDLNGFLLTWLFFSYSPVYGLFIAFSQFFGAILLIINRTKYIGVLLLIPVISNIILIDYCYEIGNDVKVISVFYLVVLLYIIQPIIGSLFKLLLFKSELTSKDKTPISLNKKQVVIKLFTTLAIAFICFYSNYIQKVKLQFTQPVMGVWKTGDVYLNNNLFTWDCSNDSIPKKIYFEKGGSCFIKYSSADHYGNYQTKADSIYIFDGNNNALNFFGKFKINDSILVLNGIINNNLPVVYNLSLIRKIK